MEEREVRGSIFKCCQLRSIKLPQEILNWFSISDFIGTQTKQLKNKWINSIVS